MDDIIEIKNDSQCESGISVEDTTSVEERFKTTLIEMTQADRELRDLNLRLANCIDMTLKSQRVPLCGNIIPNKDFESMVEDIKIIYEKDIEILNDNLKDMEKKMTNVTHESKRLDKAHSKLEKELPKSKQALNTYKNKLITTQKNLTEASNKIRTLEDELTQYKFKYEEAEDEMNTLNRGRGDREGVLCDLYTEAHKLKDKVFEELNARELDREVFFKCEKEYLHRIKQLENHTSDKELELNKFNNLMVQKLDCLRQEFENEILQHNNEIENVYIDKCEMLENELNEKNNEIYELHSILNSIRPKYGDSKTKIIQLKHQVNALRSQLDETISTKNEIEIEYKDKLEGASKKLAHITLSYNHLIQSYKNVLDNQVIQQTELTKFQKLVEGEEQRLNILPTDKPLKRKSYLSIDRDKSMIEVNSINQNDRLVFCDWNYGANYIAIKNISNKVISLDGYYIEISVTKDTTIKYCFEKQTQLNPEESITIWGKSCDKNIVLKNDIIANNVTNWFENSVKNIEPNWRIVLKDPKDIVLSILDIKKCKGSSNRYNSKKCLTHKGPINASRKSCIIC